VPNTTSPSTTGSASGSGGAAPRGYLRQPTISNGRICFIAEDDLWTVEADGGTASRLTVTVADIATPVLSPDGTTIAFAGLETGDREAYWIPAEGGAAERLTYFGIEFVLGWTPDGAVCANSPFGQPFTRPSGRHGGDHTWAYAIGLDGSPPERLPYGPVSALGFGTGGAMVLGRNGGDPAWWKRYRGGTAGQIWTRADEGAQWRRIAGELEGNLVCPMLVGSRVYFLSDHQGIGNLYSTELDGSGLLQHTGHDDYYARWASTDGRSIVYQQGADIWVLDTGTDQTTRIDIRQGGARPQRSPRFVEPEPNLGEFSLHPEGHSLALGVRGKPFTMPLFDGPVRQHGVPQGARYRLIRWCGSDGTLVALSDHEGEDRIEIHPPGGADVRVLAVDGVSNLVDLAPSPDGTRLALATLDRRLVVVSLEDGSTRTLDESSAGWIGDLSWSPDGAFIAYAYPSSARTQSIRICTPGEGDPIALTAPEFFDFQPHFDPTGKWVAFLSKRVFDPVPDGVIFTYGFPKGVRPYLVTLRADDPSPLRPAPRGMAPVPAGGEPPTLAVVRVDAEGIADRVQVVDVPENRYVRLEIVGKQILLVAESIHGSLGTDWTTGQPSDGVLESYDLAEQRHEILLSGVQDVSVSADGSTLVARVADGLRAMAAGKKPAEGTEQEPPGRRSGRIDLARVRVEVDPGAEWRQMFTEAWRLQRDHFWDPGLSGIDWSHILTLYLPLVDRVATRTELSDLIWEMQGELGTSHAYEMLGDRRQPPPWQMGRLGADFDLDTSGVWRVAHIVRADSWAPESSSALVGPGVRIAEGDALLAIGGQRLGPGRPPGAALINRAEQDVELLVERPTDPGPRPVVVRTLKSELPGRYREWVNANRTTVHQRTGGRAGYLHIPDMGTPGFSEFHRAYLAEGERDALVVDVRHNGGGNVSALLLAKLAIPRLGEAVSRWLAPQGYPAASVPGPMVALTDEWCGSDGDIFANAFSSLDLGPTVGTRTWGGVIGIEPQVRLADGTVTTQPEYAFWFKNAGWDVENRGVSPGYEVVITPEDWDAGADPQLDAAIDLVLDALAADPLERPTRP
jgi:tricorn protease